MTTKLLALCSAFLFLPLVGLTASPITLYLGEGCGECGELKEQLQAIDLAPLDIIEKDVYRNPDDATAFTAETERLGIPLAERRIPMLVTQGVGIMGVDQIVSTLQQLLENPDTILTPTTPPTEPTNSRITLPIVIGAALVDAINPCAFAVLVILMTTLLITSTRKKALYAGLAFSLSIFISYLLMGLGLYKVVSTFETSQLFVTIVGVVAIILGLANLKDFFWYGKYFLIEVPRSWRPRLRRLLESVASPIGAFFTGFLVSLFLLPCTSGPYVVIISMLGHSTTYLRAVEYLILYNLVFILPMLLITGAVYKGLDIDTVEDIRQRHLRTLHLIAGVLLLAIGVFILW